MASRLEYHSFMRRGLLVAVIAGVLAVPAVTAQINGTRASVTSVGGNPFFPPGPRASVTSLGPNGFTPNFRSPNCCFSFGTRHHHPNGFLNGRNGNGRFGYGLPVYLMPYSYGDVVEPVDDSMEQAYGPAAASDQSSRTQAILQRYDDDRLSRLEQQMDELESTGSKQPKTDKPEQAAVPVADQPETVLVFRDGHSVDVKNYAIVGDTLYDFSDGARKKIALADLDLNATRKENDERGLDFRLPNRPLGN